MKAHRSHEKREQPVIKQSKEYRAKRSRSQKQWYKAKWAHSSRLEVSEGPPANAPAEEIQNLDGGGMAYPV